LRGRNLAYVDRHLPHLARLLTPEAPELLEHASLLVLGSDVAEVVPWSSCFAGAVIDLRKDLAAPAPSIAAEGAATEEVVLAGSSFAF
jgi:GDP-mannose 6-dehydrogenase